MTIFRHELRQGRTALMIWTVAIGAMAAMCVALYPQMRGEMETMSAMFADMGAFTQAFGMDRLGIGTMLGFYAVECGSIIGLGGALYAAMEGAGALAKEEQGHTAEFLLSHPISRARVLTEKLAALLVRVLVMNVLLFACCYATMLAVGESVPMADLGRLHIAYALVQAELACVCFGLSAFMTRGAQGAGLGLATAMYFLNLIANISEEAKVLKLVTPFAYAECADIVTSGVLDGGRILLGVVYAAVCVIAAYIWYGKKDIR